MLASLLAFCGGWGWGSPYVAPPPPPPAVSFYGPAWEYMQRGQPYPPPVVIVVPPPYANPYAF